MANEHTSDMQQIVCGVSQLRIYTGAASVLVYINDRDSDIGGCDVRLYADDRVMHVPEMQKKPNNIRWTCFKVFFNMFLFNWQ